MSSCKTIKNEVEEIQPNRLFHESSPYLRQHAFNPVDWYPWGEEALDHADKENKLMIVSIGYSSCHWCHVMEKESFSDSAVADLMNEHFVSVKVDREERPDVDQIYIDAAMLLTGRAGWPLNAITLPDGRPVFVGTYFPKGQWASVLRKFKNKWKEEPEILISQADDLEKGIVRYNEVNVSQVQRNIDEKDIKAFAENWIDKFDRKLGAYPGTPKFPIPYTYQTLLTYDYYYQSDDARSVVKTTLDQIAAGGIYDHLAGGFARYATDQHWKVPHFEKMLYDNAQLLSTYSDAYMVFRYPSYKKVIEQTADFMIREWQDASGGFYSSYDADTEGEEGKYYVWKSSEIDSLLGSSAKPFCDFFNVKGEGNWENGQNILYRVPGVMPDSSLIREMEILKEHRRKRINPALDDKIITSWNALAVSGFTDAYRALQDEKYRNVAIRAGEFLFDRVSDDNSITRIYHNDRASISGFLDDYAMTIRAFVDLYQLTFEEQWLYKARDLTEYTLKNFRDEKSGFFYYTPADKEVLITRKIDNYDNVIPSPNSVMAQNLFILGQYFFNEKYIQISQNMINAILPQMEGDIRSHANWFQLILHLNHPYYEVAMVGKDYEGFLQEINSRFLPNKIVLGGENEGTLKLLENKLFEGETRIYVCMDKSCKLPVREAEKAIAQIRP